VPFDGVMEHVPFVGGDATEILLAFIPNDNNNNNNNNNNNSIIYIALYTKVLKHFQWKKKIEE